jgi:hypothetical protein
MLQDTGKAAQLAIAQSIAVLCIAAGTKQTSSTVTKLLQTLQVADVFNRQSMLPKRMRAAVYSRETNSVRPLVPADNLR